MNALKLYRRKTIYSYEEVISNYKNDYQLKKALKDKNI